MIPKIEIDPVRRSGELPTLLSYDLDAIEAAVARVGNCKMIVVDPVSAYLAGTDDHRNAELRGVLSPLKAMAERLNVAVVLVSHLSKGGGTNGKHRVIGSIAFVGACRANFLFVRDRNDATGQRVLMCDNGGNLAPTAQPFPTSSKIGVTARASNGTTSPLPSRSTRRWPPNSRPD